jgi:hypothetical protein
MQRTHRLRDLGARVSIAPLLMTIAIVGLFSGSTCVVAYSSCTCNPCFQPCPCNEFCNETQTVDFEAARTLTTYELAVVVEPDARTTRIYSQIVGISIARALGTADYGAEDVRAFATSVIAVNRELFELPGENARWDFETLDLFDTAHVVTFRATGSRRGTARSLTLLFDRRGNLIEIDASS